MGTMRDSRFAVESPVGGLSRRRLPFAAVLAQAVAAVAPAGVMSILPGLVLSVSGANLFLTFALAWAVTALVALSLRPMTQRMAAVSGLYGYVAKGLGPESAVFAGWSALFGYAMIGMAGLFAVGSYLAQGAQELGVPARGIVPLTALVIAIASAAMTTTMVRGVRVSSRVILGVECVAIAILLGLMIWYLIVVGLPHGSPPPQREPAGIGGVAVGVVLGIGAFVGFESSTTLGGEARKPLQSIPRALTWTMFVGGCLYLVAVAFQEYVLRPLQPEGSAAPLVALLDARDSPVVAFVIDLCIASSFFACAAASLNALVRVLFCMGREGVLPRAFGRAHPRFRTPHLALWITMPVVTAVPLALSATNAPPGAALTGLILLSVFGYLSSYLFAAIAMPVFLRRIGEDRPANWWLAGVTALALALVTAGAIVLWSVHAPILPILYFAVMVVATVHLAILRHRWPHRLAAVGVYDETLPDDVLNVEHVLRSESPDW